jgi:hypothetical protein
MEKSRSGSLPLYKENQAAILTASSNDRSQDRDIENFNALLSLYYKGLIKYSSLFAVLKEAEEQGKQDLIRIARSKLEGVFVDTRRPFVFKEIGEGLLTVEMVTKEKAGQER